jgi:hypothetical protein
MNNDQKNLLTLPASYPLFELANCEDCELKLVHQGEGQSWVGDKNW